MKQTHRIWKQRGLLQGNEGHKNGRLGVHGVRSEGKVDPPNWEKRRPREEGVHRGGICIEEVIQSRRERDRVAERAITSKYGKREAGRGTGRLGGGAMEHGPEIWGSRRCRVTAPWLVSETKEKASGGRNR